MAKPSEVSGSPNQLLPGATYRNKTNRKDIHIWVKSEYSMNYRKLLAELRVDEKTVVEFFVAFSRFEFALKQAGYLKARNGKAKPDWDAFAKKHENELDPEKEPELREAWNYLDKDPPKTQVVVDGKLDFEVDERLKGKSPFEKATRVVRTVRNNLFHGGKFPRSGVVDDPARKATLLKKCMILLEEMLEIDPDVKTEFYRTEEDTLFR